jgi:hypothetical protein
MPKKFLVLFILLLTASSGLLAQTLQTLKNQPPDGAGIAFLMTDGTVIVQGNNDSDWAKLTPDNKGSYVNGTWKSIASLESGYAPDAFASAVLADGRLIIEGGEYNNGQFAFTNLGEVYDPVTDKWTPQKPPRGWGFIGDSPSSMLPNGHFLLGSKFNKQIAELDPATLEWTNLRSTGKNDRNAEEGWTLMPDGSVLTYDVTKAPHSERYIYPKQEWVSAGSTIVDLHSPTDINGCIPYGKKGCYYPPGEVGPGILRPDGTVFATGSGSDGGSGPGHTSVYDPSTGKWTPGPDFPNDDNAGDSFAVLLPNGNALVLGLSGTLYEFDGKKLIIDPVGGVEPVLMLPTGQVFAPGFSVQVYNPKGTYQKSWAPVITAYPKTVARGSTYKISGQQFNGLSQAAAFGDEFETATNYPLVRITNKASGHVFYAKTHDHSTMGVATGTATVFTNFDVPSGIETGASVLEVVANGIPSKKVGVTVE